LLGWLGGEMDMEAGKINATKEKGAIGAERFLVGGLRLKQS